MPAVLALICAYADLKLECVEARNQEHNAGRKDYDKLPRSFGYQECSAKDACEQPGEADAHYHPHRSPYSSVLFLYLFCHVEQKLFVFLFVILQALTKYVIFIDNKMKDVKIKRIIIGKCILFT